jgi:hypothetical protein
VQALDDEARRLSEETGLPCSRASALKLLVKRHLPYGASTALVEAPTVPVQRPARPEPAPAKVKGHTLDEKAMQRAVQKVHGYTKSLGDHLGLAPQTVHGWATQNRPHSWPEDRLNQVRQWISEHSASVP